jgi:hypothetical protein
VGIALAKCGAKVDLTDYEDEVLDGIRRNVEINGLAQPQVNVLALDWAQETAAQYEPVSDEQEWLDAQLDNQQKGTDTQVDLDSAVAQLGSLAALSTLNVNASTFTPATGGESSAGEGGGEIVTSEDQFEKFWRKHPVNCRSGSERSKLAHQYDFIIATDLLYSTTKLFYPDLVKTMVARSDGGTLIWFAYEPRGSSEVEVFFKLAREWFEWDEIPLPE